MRAECCEYRLGLAGSLILVLFVTADVRAFSLFVDAPQIKSVLALTFPYQTRMGGSHITLTDPKPYFYEASQEVGVALHLAIKDQVSGRVGRAITMVRGGIRFDSRRQQLQLVKPKIARLDWAGKPGGIHPDFIDQVTRLVGQELPIIVLLDINQLAGDVSVPALTDIKIRKKAIEIVF